MDLQEARLDIGERLAAACDVPDLQLFPARFPGVRTVSFHAALEFRVQHLALWSLAALRRIGLPLLVVDTTAITTGDMNDTESTRSAHPCRCRRSFFGGPYLSPSTLCVSVLDPPVVWRFRGTPNARAPGFVRRGGPAQTREFGRALARPTPEAPA